MSDSADAEKEHDPTPQRLEEARQRGDVPQSADLTAAASLAGFLLALMAFGPGLVDRAGAAGRALLSEPEQIGRAELAAHAWNTAAAVTPLVLLPAGAAVAALFAQQALVFAPERLAPKLSRISPFAAAGQKFGAEGLTDFAKSALKLTLAGSVLLAFLIGRAPDIVASHMLAPGPAAALMASLLTAFLALALALGAALGALDLLLQRTRFMRRNRMTRQELLDEMKRSEGDPHLKAERRGRGREIATNRMLAEVPRADVVIVNPTHFAVALRWDRGKGRAPVCLAKGVDEIAARIRAAAAAAGVPLHSDPATARALHASLEVGDEVRPEHYRAVAAAIRFSEAMRRRARGLSRR
jgi:flagellar biosynthetic protein FlhB